MPFGGCLVDARAIEVTLPRPAVGCRSEHRVVRLEWLAVLYELDPGYELLDEYMEADNLEYDFAAIYPRLNPNPLYRRIIKAKPATGKVDILGSLRDYLIKKAYKAIDSVVIEWVPSTAVNQNNPPG